jgi:hypothetical protein
MAKLPPRQKILIGIALIFGLFLMVGSVFALLSNDTLNTMITCYGIGVPLFLLMFDTVIDLNNKLIFGIWLTIGILTFIIWLTTFNNEKFLIIRSDEFNKDSGINDLLGSYSTSSLKALLMFLIVYWPFNKLLNRQGLFLVNTFKQFKWYHDGAQREITALDVVINMILYVVILGGGLFLG